MHVLDAERQKRDPVRAAPLVIDVDATLVTAHSEKEGAAATFKSGFGHHPLWAFLDHGPDGTGEPVAALLRPGNAGSNTAADHSTVIRAALRQLPGHRAGRRPGRKVLIRVDGAGATHELLDWLAPQRLSYSVGFGLTQAVVDQLAALPDRAWQPAYNADGEPASRRLGHRGHRPDVAPGPSGWPKGMRVIVRKERPHPGAQLRLTDPDGHRYTAFATNTAPAVPAQLADLELRHRRRARAEDRIRAAKDTGLRNLPRAPPRSGHHYWPVFGSRHPRMSLRSTMINNVDILRRVPSCRSRTPSGPASSGSTRTSMAVRAVRSTGSSSCSPRIVGVVGGILDAIFSTRSGMYGGTGPIQGILQLALLLPSLAVGARRLHDTGRSGWWLLIGLIPLVGWIILLVFFVQDSKPSNQHGPNPKGLGEGHGAGYSETPSPAAAVLSSRRSRRHPGSAPTGRRRLRVPVGVPWMSSTECLRPLGTRPVAATCNPRPDRPHGGVNQRYRPGPARRCGCRRSSPAGSGRSAARSPGGRRWC